MTAEAHPPAQPPSSDGDQGRRYLVVAAVVGLWMAVGIVLHLSGDAYLIAGVPLLAAFQVFVARRPVAELWFKSPSGAPLPLWAWLVAAAFMGLPAYSLVGGWAGSDWSVRLWYLCAIAGAVPLAYSLARFKRADLPPLVWCFATAGVLGILLVAVPLFLTHHHPVVLGANRNVVPFKAMPGPRLAEVARSFFLYLPVVFVLEEVFFRGGLDSYLHRPGDRAPWGSAAFVSALWGLWHLPLLLPALLRIMYPWAAIGFLAIVLMFVHCAVGIPLSAFWRRSGLLFVPGIVHAFIDAVRNGLQLH